MVANHTRVKECDECGGVMRSVWSDGKTRTHKLNCVRCDYSTDDHQRNTRYVEVRHANPWEDLDIQQDFEDFMAAVETLKRESTDEAFERTVETTSWAWVQVSRNRDGSYTVAAYGDRPDEGEGRGDDGDLPYGQPDVSWTAEAVYVGNHQLEIVPLNGGTGHTYLSHVWDVDIKDEGRFMIIEE